MTAAAKAPGAPQPTSEAKAVVVAAGALADPAVAEAKAEFAAKSGTKSGTKADTKSAPARPGLRQRMAWLHTWGGLWFCWLAYAIFLTGTLSVFVDPLTRWMKPELPPLSAQPVAVPTEPGAAIEHGLRFLRQRAPDSRLWEMWPRPGQDSMMVYWMDQHDRYAEARLSVATGAELPTARGTGRDTLGGNHFVEFHHELHAGRAGLWIVGAASVAMLVALISGVITHKRIFQDFFTFRPGKGQRSWLDAHNALGVLTLPFLFMIVYSGLAISWPTYMPAVKLAPLLRGDGAAKSIVESDSPSGRPASGKPGVLTALAPLVRAAETAMNTPTFALVVHHPGDAAMTVEVYGEVSPATQRGKLFSTRGMIEYDGVTGAQRSVRPAHQAPDGVARSAMFGMDELHRLHFADAAVRWLYFVSGLAGTAMMASGAILFMLKRRHKSQREFGAATPRVYRLIETLNIASISGLAVACIGFLWANRLLPLDLVERHEWEVAAFFGVWLLTLLHAAWQPGPRGWTQQLLAAAALCLALPLLNWISTGDQLVSYLLRGDWQRAGVELTSLAFGGLFLLALRRLRARAALAAATAATAAGKAGA
ncbi:PepSY-associated TM helix domain-containing protein [Rugamonas sp. DEMB1]|uniref:PepSY-associated TM helix domain-containing protein n=1 Tax=Rugamonas sp. DEMB1 TaxID=3039386 RepID=UPI00244C38AC|nr:PepSY-associated TM helix domain-containing protein [Rugamonas sp. DEMB1]WGG50462.1 PepSY-associated TM helix domain-containing protein [Rugamonas sp. DEMB1]